VLQFVIESKSIYYMEHIVERHGIMTYRRHSFG